MKKRQLTITLILLSFIVLSFTSCLQKQRKLKTETYIAGAEVIDRMIYMYQDIEEANFTRQYQSELISILTAEDTISIYNNFQNNFTEDLDKKLAAFRALKKVYQTYNLLSDKNFNLKNSKLTHFITIACQSVDSLTYDEEILAQSIEIQEYVNSTKIDQSLVIYKLTGIYVKLWEKDAKNWEQILDKAYLDYSTGLEQVPVNAFDEEKLTKFVYKPYKGKNTLVKIYKLNLKEEAYKQKTETVNKIDNLSLLFEKINSINLEYTKKIPEEGDIEYKIDKINEILFPELFEQYPRNHKYNVQN